MVEPRQPPPTKWTISISSPAATGTAASPVFRTITRLCSTTTIRGSRPRWGRRVARVSPSGTSRGSPLMRRVIISLLLPGESEGARRREGVGGVPEGADRRDPPRPCPTALGGIPGGDPPDRDDGAPEGDALLQHLHPEGGAV